MRQIVLVLILFSSVAFGQNEILHPKKIVPKQIYKKFPLGMSENDFKKSNPDLSGDNSFSFRTEYTITDFSAEIKEIIFYFNNSGNKELYEYIIKFNEENIRDKNIAKFKSPNIDAKTWQWLHKDGTKIRAWIFGSSLVVAAAYPKSEWDGLWK